MAFGRYRLDDASGQHLAHIDVLTLRGTRIDANTAFTLPGLFAAFGLSPRAGPTVP